MSGRSSAVCGACLPARTPADPPGPRTRLAISFLVLLAAIVVGTLPADAQVIGPERCAECHRTLNDSRLSGPAESYPSDVHAQRGFGCLACHGGVAGHEAAAGFLSRPSRTRIPELCGSCHSDAAYMRDFNPSLRVDQVAEYVTSVHGQRLALGDTAVATCVDCHRAHATRPPTDPQSSIHAANVASTCTACHADTDYMAPYGTPTDQLEQYRESVHGQLMLEDGDLSAPTCNDCHGNHGAAPPGIGSIRNVCGQCHATIADFFDESDHFDIFEEAGLPGCETCHGNHLIQPVSDENLGQRATDVCADCHEPTDTLGGEFIHIARLLDSLKVEFERSRSLLETAENAGMEVSQALFELEDVNNALTQARSAIHSFHVEPVAEKVGEGLTLTQAGIDRGNTALDEHRFRRVGLAASATIILILITGLLLKIRQLDRASRTDTERKELNA